MTEIVIRVPDELAAAVKAIKEWIPAMEIVCEKPCVNKTIKKQEVDEGNNKVLHSGVDFSDVPQSHLFIEKSKEVARKIGELNGKKLTVNPKGKAIDFVAHFDAESCCGVLDELYENYESYIDDYLSGVQKPSGISIVLPFVGKILEYCIFSSQQSMHKENLTKKLREIYKDNASIVGYLSYDGRKRKKELKELAKKVVDIAIERGVAHLNW